MAESASSCSIACSTNSKLTAGEGVGKRPEQQSENRDTSAIDKGLLVLVGLDKRSTRQDDLWELQPEETIGEFGGRGHAAQVRLIPVEEHGRTGCDDRSRCHFGNDVAGTV
jgi:hypothetical protein